MARQFLPRRKTNFHYTHQPLLISLRVTSKGPREPLPLPPFIITLNSLAISLYSPPSFSLLDLKWPPRRIPTDPEQKKNLLPSMIRLDFHAVVAVAAHALITIHFVLGGAMGICRAGEWTLKVIGSLAWAHSPQNWWYSFTCVTKFLLILLHSQ